MQTMFCALLFRKSSPKKEEADIGLGSLLLHVFKQSSMLYCTVFGRALQTRNAQICLCCYNFHKIFYAFLEEYKSRVVSSMIPTLEQVPNDLFAQLTRASSEKIHDASITSSYSRKCKAYERTTLTVNNSAMGVPCDRG